MAHYDNDTRTFMDEVSGSAKSVAKDLVRGKKLTQAIGKQIVAVPTFAALEKQSGIKILGLYKLLNSHYGEDWHDWEPETIWQTIKMDHDIEATEFIKNAVQALQVVVKTNAPFEHWHVFEKVGHAFNENPVSFADMQPLELDECALTVAILKQLRDKIAFDPEILGYIAACAKNAGVVLLLKEMFPAGSQEFLDSMENNLELKQTMLTRFGGEIPKNDEDPVYIQNEKLKAIESYVKEGL